MHNAPMMLWNAVIIATGKDSLSKCTEYYWLKPSSHTTYKQGLCFRDDTWD